MYIYNEVDVKILETRDAKLIQIQESFQTKKIVVQVFKGTVDNVPADVSKYAI